MQIEPRVRSLGQEGPLEEEMAAHSSFPAWRIPWTEEPSGLQSMGDKELDMIETISVQSICWTFLPLAFAYTDHFTWNSFIYLTIKQMFIGQLICAKHR